MATKKVIKKIKASWGDNVYIIGRMDGRKFVPSRNTKYYKTKTAALRIAKK